MSGPALAWRLGGGGTLVVITVPLERFRWTVIVTSLPLVRSESPVAAGLSAFVRSEQAAPEGVPMPPTVDQDIAELDEAVAIAWANYRDHTLAGDPVDARAAYAYVDRLLERRYRATVGARG